MTAAIRMQAIPRRPPRTIRRLVCGAGFVKWSSGWQSRPTMVIQAKGDGVMESRAAGIVPGD
jgi:hypothetical protein